MKVFQKALFIVVCFMCIESIASAQIIAENADTTLPAKYSKVLFSTKRAINTNDTIFIEGRTAYTNIDTGTNHFTLIEDSLYTATTSYYTLDTNRIYTPPVNAVYYFDNTNDTTYFYKAIDSLYAHKIHIY
ncbi:MAG: hypothetical protein ACOC4J_02270, partial [Bacteroidota bacterium]